MSMQLLKKIVTRNLSNIPGRSVRDRLVVFESDDWGAIRSAGPEARAALAQAGYRPRSADEARYIDHDGLATAEDLHLLYETLQSAQDRQGRAAVFTALSVVANPDFDAIRASEYRQYSREPLTKTLARYPHHREAFTAWQEGARLGVFQPEFHGTEHLNVAAWMRALQAGEPDTRLAFDLGMYGITPRQPTARVSYQAAYDVEEKVDISQQAEWLREGLCLFEELHGRRASFFVPPNGFLNKGLEQILKEQGVDYIGISKIQREPQGDGVYRQHRQYLGQANEWGQTYLTRNCFFEPNSPIHRDWVDACLNDIRIAFRWRKPAVISTHRCNYIGWIQPDNRAHGLKELRRLLKSILQQWPDVRFVTSAALGATVRQA